MTRALVIALTAAPRLSATARLSGIMEAVSRLAGYIETALHHALGRIGGRQ